MLAEADAICFPEVKGHGARNGVYFCDEEFLFVRSDHKVDTHHAVTAAGSECFASGGFDFFLELGVDFCREFTGEACHPPCPTGFLFSATSFVFVCKAEDFVVVFGTFNGTGFDVVTDLANSAVVFDEVGDEAFDEDFAVVECYFGEGFLECYFGVGNVNADTGAEVGGFDDDW